MGIGADQDHRGQRAPHGDRINQATRPLITPAASICLIRRQQALRDKATASLMSSTEVWRRVAELSGFSGLLHQCMVHDWDDIP